jgi:signal transduction histidine kinase
MQKSSHSRIKLLFLISTLVLLSLSIFSYVRINKLIHASKLVNHTQRVKIALERTFAELLQAETAQRGYLHARDSSFLHELSGALIKVESYQDEVDSLTRGNPTQQANVEVLRKVVSKRILFLKNLLHDGLNAKLPDYRWLQGKSLMNDVRIQVNKMQREEELLLLRDTAILNQEAYFTPLFTFILISCSLIFLVAAYFRILSELKTSSRLKSVLEQKQQELKASNEELLQRNEETLSAINRIKENELFLKQQKRQLEENNKDLLRLNKELELFNHISSHDLQEPLRKIQIFASRLQSGEVQKLSDRGKDDLSRMQDAAFRMQSLIEDLLAYSRTTTTDKVFVATNLRNIAEEVKEGFREEMQSHNAMIEVGVMCDAKIIPFQFRQLMQNLVSNAIKFSNPGKPVHIKISSRLISYEEIKKANIEFPSPDAGQPISGNRLNSQYCHISVSDNGIGFETQYKERIFEIFQRLHPKTAFRGTGIGLAIVKKIVENHNGIIHATGEPGKGACFDIYFPAR